MAAGAKDLRMRNESENIVRPSEAMSLEDIMTRLKAMTLRTTFRAWFYPRNSFRQYNNDDGEGPYLCREAMVIRAPESDAVLTGTPIDYQVVGTDFDDHVYATRNGYSESVHLWEPDAFYAIAVLKEGVEPPETLTVGNFDEVVADPALQHISIEGIELDQNDVELLVGVCQRWLQNKI